VNSTEHKDPRYVVFSTPLLPRPSQHQISSSAPYFRTLSLCVALGITDQFSHPYKTTDKSLKRTQKTFCVLEQQNWLFLLIFERGNVNNSSFYDDTSAEAFPYTLAPRRYSEVTVSLNIHAMNLKCSSKLS